MDLAITRATHGKQAILAEGLQKRYGETQALRGLDLAVE